MISKLLCSTALNHNSIPPPMIVRILLHLIARWDATPFYPNWFRDGILPFCSIIVFLFRSSLTDNLNVRITGDVNDGKVTRANEYSSSPLNGKLAFAPEHNYSIAIDYTLPLDNGWTVDFYLDNSWVAEQFSTINNDIVLPDYTRANARITANSDDGKWRVALYSTNLTNKEIIRGRGGSGEFFWFDPRQVGLEIGYQL